MYKSQDDKVSALKFKYVVHMPEGITLTPGLLASVTKDATCAVAPGEIVPVETVVSGEDVATVPSWLYPVTPAPDAPTL
jgi:hypothetical protein